MDPEAVLAVLPADMSEQDRELIAAALPLVDADSLLALMQDAQLAQLALSVGDRAGAIEIIERHRPMAEAAGMSDMLDAIITGL